MSSLATSSDQLEGLGDEIDLDKLVLKTPGLPDLPLGPLVTGGDLERTVEGASSLTLTLDDYDRAVRLSGHLVPRCDLTVDGLGFRLLGVDWQADDVTLTFEDRVVSILRGYPADDPRHGFKLWGPAKDIHQRLKFVQWLVDEVRPEASPITLITPDTTIKPVTTKQDRPKTGDERLHRRPGFAFGATITVKNQAATATQKDNLERVLKVGYSMGVDRKLLVVAIMVVTQESTALTSATNGNHVGLFQQELSPSSKWRQLGGATREPEADAHAFYIVGTQAQLLDASLTYPELAEKIQASGLDPNATYGQWQTEAERTVDAYGVAGGDVADPKQTQANNWQASTDGIDTTGLLIRGQVVQRGGRRYFVRESNWDCLGRLADEVQWRRFVVGGAVYFVHEPYLFSSAPRMRLSWGSDGVGVTSGNYRIGKRNASVTVSVRLNLWQAPPGSTVELYNMGDADGRWLVSSIRRPIFGLEAEVTLKKPRPRLPESQAPELSSGSSQTVVGAPKTTAGGSSSKPSPSTTPYPGPLGPDATGSRAAVVKVAEDALAAQDARPYRYSHQRPLNFSLFSDRAHDPGIDCSAFVTLVYQEAGAPDPSGLGYTGSPWTGSIAEHAAKVVTPQPGDVVLWSNPWMGDANGPAHTGIFVGGGKAIEIGSDNGILDVDVNYRPVWAYVSVLP